jgi:hypothetical protein
MGKRSGRKSEKPVTKVNSPSAPAGIKHGEVWWRVVRDFILGGTATDRNKKGTSPGAKMNTQLGRLWFMGVIDGNQYNTANDWQQLVEDHKRIVLGSTSGHAKISSGEIKSPGAPTEYSDATIAKVKDQYNLCKSAIGQAWDPLYALVMRDEYVEYVDQRRVKHGLTRLGAVLAPRRRNKR